MKVLDILKKYRYSLPISKTNLYKEVEKQKPCIIEAGFLYDKKSVYELFALEIIYKGIQNKKAIDSCYDQFMNTNFDMLEYSKYDEKRKMFYRDLEVVLPKLICFKDNKSQTNIYMPYLEVLLNQKYIDDYGALVLKKNQMHMTTQKKGLEAIFSLYGMQPFVSEFSSLQVVGEDDKNLYFYHFECKTVYIFDKHNGFVDEFCIIDKYSKKTETIEQVKELVNLFLNIEEDSIVITYMHEQGFLSDKVYKKINKKLG